MSYLFDARLERVVEGSTFDVFGHLPEAESLRKSIEKMQRESLLIWS